MEPIDPSIFDLLEPLGTALLAVGGPDIRGYFARMTGGVDIPGIVEALKDQKWVRWPTGDAGDAVDFACGHCPHDDALTFLEDWRFGRADEWPDYMRWLNVQRKGVA